MEIMESLCRSDAGKHDCVALVVYPHKVAAEWIVNGSV